MKIHKTFYKIPEPNADVSETSAWFSAAQDTFKTLDFPEGEYEKFKVRMMIYFFLLQQRMLNETAFERSELEKLIAGGIEYLQDIGVDYLTFYNHYISSVFLSNPRPGIPDDKKLFLRTREINNFEKLLREYGESETCNKLLGVLKNGIEKLEPSLRIYKLGITIVIPITNGPCYEIII